MQRDGGFMDMMQLRRQMMGVIAQMAGGGSVFNNLFELVASVTLEEEVYSVTFPCDLAEGYYILVSDPPGNHETAAECTGFEILSICGVQIRGLSEKTTNCYTTAIRKTPTASNAIDWWTPTVTLGEDNITINPMAGRHKLQAGFTYYFIKIKGM